MISLFANRGRPPKLLLLDETDAHLHPSQIQGFLDLLQSLSASSTKVVLAIHRIDTIGLAIEGSLRLMASSAVTQCTRAHATGAIAGFVVEAMKAARLVYVEDRADQDFYVAVDRLRPKTPRTQPSLVLQPIVAGVSGANKTGGGGGCQAIIDRVQDMRSGSVSGLVRGLIDLDTGNPAQAAIFVLCRYSIENFLFDPLVLYMESVKAGAPIPIPDGINGTGQSASAAF